MPRKKKSEKAVGRRGALRDPASDLFARQLAPMTHRAVLTGSIWFDAFTKEKRAGYMRIDTPSRVHHWALWRSKTS
jgi:hypothetical protein